MTLRAISMGDSRLCDDLQRNDIKRDVLALRMRTWLARRLAVFIGGVAACAKKALKRFMFLPLK